MGFAASLGLTSLCIAKILRGAGTSVNANKDSRFACRLGCALMTQLILKRASASRPSSERSEDDYDVLADDVVVGRIMRAILAPVGSPWFWTLAYGCHHDRMPTHGYAATREAAMAAFAKSWRRK